MRIFRFISHCIININAFMIKQLCVRNHCYVFEIFVETSRYKMGMDPLHVLNCENAHIKKLRIFTCDF